MNETLTPEEKANAMINEFYELLTWSDERDLEAIKAAGIAVKNILEIFTKRYDEDYYIENEEQLLYWKQVKNHIDIIQKDYE